eukprot:1292270-Ditylum_brightwellii.AAC.1
MLDRKIDKSGTFVMAHNDKTKESVVFSWSMKKRLGTKFVLETGFEEKKKDAESSGTTNSIWLFMIRHGPTN